jgi:alpha-mannosidase
MNIGRQWDERLRIWDDELARDIFPCIAQYDSEGFTTMEKLSFSQAKTKQFKKIPEGTKWGKKWEYGWAHASLTVPKEFRSKTVWIGSGLGPEMLVFVNGREAGSIDKMHSFVLAGKVPKNGVLDVYAEVYAGHGPRVEGAGVVRREDDPLPQVPAKQVKTKACFFGYIDEEMLEVYYDYHVLYELLKILPDTSVFAGRIFEALKVFTNTTCPEEEATVRRASYLKAGAGLKPLLLEKNGTDAPQYVAFGQSHIDLAWLWTRAETRRKTARTLSNQLALLERYDDYRFLICETVLFEWLKADYPELYERVKQAVKDGKLIPEGGMYVESDLNMAGAEALVRQFVYGKKMFREEFGTDSVLAWMPDTFGYTGALPQILKKCGIKYFATQKLIRQDPEYAAFPYNDFYWEGIDGSKILSHIYKKNNTDVSVADLCTRWYKDRLEYGKNDEMLYPFGFGDGGGGPVIGHMEILKRCRDLAGVPKVKIESPNAFFERLEGKGTDNTYFGELYLAWHRGTYTSQSEIKKLVRRAELKLRETEFLCGIARLFGEKDKDAEEQTETLYKRLLVDEFHDVLPGTSIERVNRETRDDLNDILRLATALSESLLLKLAGENAVFNSLSWDRVYKGVTLPACGIAAVNDKQYLHSSKESTGEKILASEENGENGKTVRIENGFYTALINENGEIVSLVDAKTGYEYVKEPFNRLSLYENINGEYDAWEIGENYKNTAISLKGTSSFAVRRIGKQVTVIVKREEEHFSVEQKIVFGSDTPVIDFDTKINWQERHRILKAAFPTSIFTKEVLSETQFGYIKRPTHRSRLYERGMYEIAQHRYSALTDGENGLLLLNDCKYGLSAKDGEMALTLLRAPVFPDPTADMGQHTFRYGIMPFSGPFSRSGCVNTAYEYNTEPTGDVSEIEAGLERTLSLFRVSSKNIIIETCKPAMYTDGIVLRLYESVGAASTCDLELPSNITGATLCDMLENPGETQKIEEGKVRLGFGAFEIKTLLLDFNGKLVF